MKICRDSSGRFSKLICVSLLFAQETLSLLSVLFPQIATGYTIYGGQQQFDWPLEFWLPLADCCPTNNSLQERLEVYIERLYVTYGRISRVLTELLPSLIEILDRHLKKICRKWRTGGREKMKSLLYASSPAYPTSIPASLSVPPSNERKKRKRISRSSRQKEVGLSLSNRMMFQRVIMPSQPLESMALSEKRLWAQS